MNPDNSEILKSVEMTNFIYEKINQKVKQLNCLNTTYGEIQKSPRKEMKKTFKKDVR